MIFKKWPARASRRNAPQPGLVAPRLRLLLLRRLIRLVRLVTTLWRRRGLLLLLGRRRSAVLGHLRLLWRVDARRALKGHLLHLVAQVWPLLLLLLLRWLGVRVVPADGGGHARGVAVVYG